MATCPHCRAEGARIVRSKANAMRILASFPLLALYLLGGLAGDDRGPILPLERRCPSCGRRFKGRSVLDTVRGWTPEAQRMKRKIERREHD